MLTKIYRRLKEYKDTVKLMIFTLDLITHNYSIITSADALPYDCLEVLPCATSLGGVVIITSNSIIYVDQSSRRVALPVNGWPARVSDMALPSLSSPEEQRRNLELEGSCSTFIDDRTLFIVLKDGSVYPVELVVDGKTVSRISMASALAQTTIPAVVRRMGKDHLFVGSTVGPSVLLKTARIEQEIEEDHDMDSVPTTVVDIDNGIDLDDDDGTSIFVQFNFFWSLV